MWCHFSLGISYRCLVGYFHRWYTTDIDGLVQERRNSSALTTELRLSCTKPSIWWFALRDKSSLFLKMLFKPSVHIAMKECNYNSITSWRTAAFIPNFTKRGLSDMTCRLWLERGAKFTFHVEADEIFLNTLAFALTTPKALFHRIIPYIQYNKWWLNVLAICISNIHISDVKHTSCFYITMLYYDVF